MGWLNKILEFFKSIFKAVGKIIVTVINSVLLGFVYFIGVGLTSIFAKLVGKHFLEIRLSKKESYWSRLRAKKSKEDYYRQF